MTAPAVTQGQLVDVRNVNAHKCIRLVIDIPAELAPRVIAAFGWPTQVNPVPVAIARLTEEASQSPRPALPSQPAGADKRVSYAQRLGIACNEPAFWQFVQGLLPQKHYIRVDSEATAADAVRYLCGVKSRSETIKGTPAGDKAHNLLLDYDNYVRGAA